MEERIDLSENQGNNGNMKNSDCGNDEEINEISLDIKEEAVEAFQSALKPAKKTQYRPPS